MPVRNGSSKIIRPSLPPLTSVLNVYIPYGQSNSTGTAALMLQNTSDPTGGAVKVFGRDGGRTRDGTSLVWTDLNYPPAVLDFSGLANTEMDEPNRTYIRETFFHSVARVLNRRQIKATGERHNSVFMGFGHTGFVIARLVKTQTAYTNLINGVTKLLAVAAAKGYSSVRIQGVLYVQGEADFATSGSGYAATLAQLQTDLNTDLKALSGQAQNIPMFITQQSNFSNNFGSGIAYPLLDQLSAHTTYPGSIILATPMYQGETKGSADLHYYGHQADRWGSGFGNAVATKVIDGQAWNPVMPKTVSRSGAVITVQFWVPVGPLVLDTNYVTNTADGLYGFDYRQTGGSAITLQSVAQTAPDTLQFTLSGTPDGTNQFLRAGRNSAGASTAVAGFRTGARTCLRDSADPEARYCNWCVHFDQPIT